MATISFFFFSLNISLKNWHFSQLGFKIQTIKHVIKHIDLYFKTIVL